MRERSAAQAAFAAIVLAGLTSMACGRPLFDKVKPSVERINPSITASQLRVLAPVSGGDALTDFQISVTVRQQLQDSGFTIIRRAGRWDTQPEAVRAICAPGDIPSVDAVLFVWYNRLELRDCGTGATAYEITSGGQEGITVLTDRLIKYLRKEGANASSTQPAAPPNN